MQLETEITAETEYLKAKQRTIVDAEIVTLQNSLKELRHLVASEQETFQIIHEKVLKSEDIQQLLTENAISLQKKIDVLTVEKEDIETRKRLLKNTVITENSKLFQLKESMHLLPIEKDNLEKTINNLKNEESVLLSKITDLKVDIDNLNEEYITTSTKLSNGIDIKTIELKELINYEKKTRQELAAREISLNEREKTIRIRERQADTQEQIIHQNAGLLDL